MKVHELAKELGITSKALTTLLKKNGINVKGHMSVLDEDVVEKIRQHFEEGKKQSKTDIQKKDDIYAKTHNLPKKKKEPVSEDSSEEETDVSQVVKDSKTKDKEKTTPKFKKYTKKVESSKEIKSSSFSKSKVSEVKKEDTHKKKKTRAEDKAKKYIEESRDVAEIDTKVRETLKKIESKTTRKKYKKKKSRQTDAETEPEVVKIPEGVTTAEFAKLIDAEVVDIIETAMDLGYMVTINQRLPFELLELIAEEYGVKIELSEEYKEEKEEDKEHSIEKSEEDETNLQPRHPVVTIMGHVDHGKTTLLDYIRKSSITQYEAGGITQHIGAYEVETPNGKITFIDTPGHEAFTAMRARGANVTDIIILIVAADAGVMPQTKEAISHAKAAGVPIIIAINKVDLPEANVERVKSQLAEEGLLVEDWGGKYQCVEISAKTGHNVDELLERILLEAEVLELKANFNTNAEGIILESKLHKGLGPVGTVLVQKGTLKKGDVFVAGHVFGRVRALINDRGERVEKATPSTPVQVVGFEEVPHAGDTLKVYDSEKEAKEIVKKRQQSIKEKERQIAIKGTAVSLEDLYNKVKAGEAQVLNLIIKGDVDGSIEAIADSLVKLSNDEVKINVIHKAVGEIKESDVLLASASQAIIIGFNVRPNSKARELAKKEGVEIKNYKIIYDIIEDVKKALQGMLKAEEVEEVVGELEVRETFKISKVGTVAGCYVKKGYVTRKSKVRLIREGIVIYDGEISGLKRFKEDVAEVKEGYECGVSLNNYNDIKVGDIIEVYEIRQIERKLE